MITSDGRKYKTLNRKNEAKIWVLQMRQSKKVKWSKRYKQLKTKIAKLHKHDANRRSNYLHKVSKELVTNYDLIGIENLNTRLMMSNHCLAKAIGNQWRNMLVSMLEYKAVRYWKQTHKVSRWYPSSKQCNNCWNLKRDLKLSDRVYVCECWYSEDRDINAAKNILTYTQRELKF
jgi:putative transposase